MSQPSNEDTKYLLKSLIIHLSAISNLLEEGKTISACNDLHNVMTYISAMSLKY